MPSVQFPSLSPTATGIKLLPCDQDVREAILRVLYTRGEPMPTLILLDGIRIAPGKAAPMFDDYLDILRGMLDNGDVIMVPPRATSGRYGYYLSAREFVRLAARGEEADALRTDR